MNFISLSNCDDYVVQAIAGDKLRIPFFESLLPAGFPSPATDYMERVCDLNDLCVSNAEATYFVRVTGDSMRDDRIEPGDILVVDSSCEATDGRIVVAWHNGGHTVKRIHYASEMTVLMPANDKYEPVYIHPGDDFRLFGVVRYVIQKVH